MVIFRTDVHHFIDSCGRIFNLIVSVSYWDVVFIWCRLCLCDGCWHVWNIFAYYQHNKCGECKTVVSVLLLGKLHSFSIYDNLLSVVLQYTVVYNGSCIASPYPCVWIWCRDV